ncbi:MAG: histidine kinase [Sphingomonas sp. SCN 67-18]|uniref:ATP-binding protein n=1 Tax=uncultured Sphingomonas sp. TaxID=158754 RepID=UPI00086E5DE1|nr:ATP-binding protein [Sphingomonas sp. SCN 67-18]ODU20041.1 MAG: histidine kinase [Sphingomonas sp. SCN 67-18]
MSEDISRIDGEETGSIGWRRSLVAVVAAIAAIALAILIAMVSLSNQQRDKALSAQSHSFEVMIMARTLESTITRSEAALGRYVISGDNDVGRYYYEQWRRAGTLIEQLSRLTRDNPQHVARIAALRELYRQRGLELSATALRTTYGQGWNALSKYYQAGQAKSLVEIASTLDQIIDTERRVLNQRTGVAAITVDRSNRLASILSVVGVVVVLFAAALAWTTLHAIAQRRLARRDAEEETQRADELEYAVTERTLELREANDRLQQEAIERAHAESQLRQIQKMEAVGQLTGGIAHDFNNMLAVVIGGLELARRRFPAGAADGLRHIDNAMEGANRAAALTRRLLAFARSEPLLPQALTPDALILGMSDLLDRTLGERIEVKTECAPDAWKSWVDRHQLENAILNLAVNARDAMDGEGTLTIRTGNRTLAEGEVGEAPAGDYVVISVTDDGCGMAPDVLERVFEPFFTTKPVGKGTGLGLSQIFGFVRQSQGEIQIESVAGEGTTVSILLPRHSPAEGEETASAPQAEATPVMPSGTHEILVVEDDPRVLTSTVDALRELGYRPIPCPAPDEAAALMKAHPAVRLIVSDVVMPGTTGPELIASLRPDYPDVGILFVTGFAGDAVDEAAAFGGHGVLRKPFTIGALAAAVEDALPRSSGRSRFAAAGAKG